MGPGQGLQDMLALSIVQGDSPSFYEENTP
jgi:hypothetical protein